MHALKKKNIREYKLWHQLLLNWIIYNSLPTLKAFLVIYSLSQLRNPVPIRVYLQKYPISIKDFYYGLGCKKERVREQVTTKITNLGDAFYLLYFHCTFRIYRIWFLRAPNFFSEKIISIIFYNYFGPFVHWKEGKK